ncbi:hypothetical protein OROGR_020721 [Orobanche gracilis]
MAYSFIGDDDTTVEISLGDGDSDTTWLIVNGFFGK